VALSGSPLERLAGRIGLAPRLTGEEHLFTCPGNQHRRPSLKVRERADGSLLIHCHAGCSTAAVLQAIGMTEADLYPRQAQSGQASK
jgi:hypothetical protein